MRIELKNNRILNIDYKDQPYFPFFWNAIFVYTFVYSYTSKDLTNFFVGTNFMNLIAQAMPCPECSAHIIELKDYFSKDDILSKPRVNQNTLWKLLSIRHLQANGKFISESVAPSYLKKKIKDNHIPHVKDAYYNPFVL